MACLNTTITVRVNREWLILALAAHHTAGALIFLASLCHKCVESCMRRAAVVEGAR